VTTAERKRANFKRYSERNRETVLASKLKWYAKNKERASVAHKAWLLANKEHVKEHQREYRKKTYVYRPTPTSRFEFYHSESYADLAARNHTARAGGVSKLDPKDVVWLKQQNGGRCIDCAKPFGGGVKFTVGHAIPISRGGRNERHNLMPQCYRCNVRQHNKIHPSVGLVVVTT
jgi:5-methylcytosine-specific restriction endonuclease McrA